MFTRAYRYYIHVSHTRVQYQYALVDMLETCMGHTYAGLNLFQLGDMHAEHVSS